MDWSAVGGHPALDLCNTVAWRRDPAREIDRLTSPDALADWFEKVARPALSAETWTGSVRADGGVPAGAGDEALRAVKSVREGLVRVLRAQTEGEQSSSRVMGSLVEAGREAGKRARLGRGLPLSWEVDVRTLDDVATVLALTVDDLLRDRDRLQTLRECQGEGCGWLFLDTTRNHSRRWCIAEDCGNRARVRAYVQRKRQER